MKKDLHPTNYRTIVVEDISNGWRFLTKSTAVTEEETKWEDGNNYPLLKVHISSASHPFYTGQEKLMDVEGRVDRFKARSDAASAQKDRMAKKAAKKVKRADKGVETTQTKIGATNYDLISKKKPAQKAPKVEAKAETPAPAEAKVEETAPVEATTTEDVAA